MTYTADSPLDGSPQASQEQAVAFLVKRGLDQATAATIVTAYWRYAPLAHLDPIVLLAQAVHETTNVKTGQPFGSWWSSPPRRNPAGIGVTGESRPHVADGAPDWQPMDNVRDYRGYAFGSWDAAVLAHVVHLAAYRYRDGAAVPGSIARYFTESYDPRLPDVSYAGYRGIARVLRDLNGRWAKPGPTYGQSIAQVANEIVATPGGVPVTPTPTPTPGGTMTGRIALTAGHHNAQGGDASEIEQTGKLIPAVAAACRALGMDVRVLTPDDGRGMSPNGLDTVAAQVVTLAQQGWVANIYMEAHTEAGPPGVFCIYPDWGSDVDTDVRDKLGPDLARRVAQATGLRVRGNGLMSEQQTAVGAGGDRLGIFRVTEPAASTTTRLIVEYGSHTDAGDMAILSQSGFYQRAGQATAEAFAAFLGIQASGGGTVSTEDQNRKLLLAKVEAEVPVQYRGALTREGRFDASAFGGSANERVAVYEKLRCHTLSGSVVAFALSGDTSYDRLLADGHIVLY